MAVRIFFRWIAPLILPLFFQQFIRRQEKQFQSYYDRYRNDRGTEENPQVNAPRNSKSSGGNSADDDYIDFEEIK